MGCCGRKTRYTVLMLVGVVLIVLPIAFRDFVNNLIRKKIDSSVKIENGSQIYDQWHKPEIPVYLQIYTFSILNSMEVKQGKPPIVVEKGPYSYKESRTKVNISWGDNNVTYNQVTRYVFDNETSCQTCDPDVDKFTTFNIPLMTIAQLLKPFSDTFDWKEFSSFLMSVIGEHPFIERTVTETVWGYEEPLFKMLSDLENDLEKRFPFLKDLLKKLPQVPSRFALQPNPKYGGVTTVNTGQCHVDLVGQFLKWKGESTLPYWKSKIANMLNGTGGAIYKPHVSEDDLLYIFVTQLCRSLYLKYLSKTTIRGISGLRFHPPSSIFQSGDINPDNKGFCIPDCLPSGLLSLKTCLPLPAPIATSSPHFLNGDPKLRKKVLGLHPDSEKHDTFVHLEPNTGILLQASKRLQFNLHVEAVDHIRQTSGLASTYVPIMWINEFVSIDAKNADKLKRDLEKLEIIKWVKIGLYIFGGILVLISLVLFIRLCCQKKSNETSLNLVAENDGKNYGGTSSGGHVTND